jgi:hypothetical protein
MKAASINEIRAALKDLEGPELAKLCLRLARAKKETKELLTYLLFEAQDEQAYINSVKAEIEEGLASINSSNPYLVKKSLRRLLRLVNKYIRFSGQKETEAELLICFCAAVKAAGIPMHRSGALTKFYENVYKKAKAVIETLHEDLQYDYLRRIGPLSPGGGT